MAKRPRDLNQLAKLVVDIASGEVKDTVSEEKRSGPRRGYAGGIKGGSARAEKLSSDQRRTIAIRAAEARWRGVIPKKD
jgi:hypothetical protein